MTEAIEKAKTIIQAKFFCFTELQLNDVKERGDVLMEIEDMEHLLSVALPEQKLLSHDMEKYDSVKLFSAIEEAKSKGMDGVRVLWSLIENDDVLKIHEMGYFVEFIGPGDIGDEIYFTEDGLIKNRIFDFKHLFRDLKILSQSNVI